MLPLRIRLHVSITVGRWEGGGGGGGGRSQPRLDLDPGDEGGEKNWNKTQLENLLHARQAERGGGRWAWFSNDRCLTAQLQNDGKNEGTGASTSSRPSTREGRAPPLPEQVDVFFGFCILVYGMTICTFDPPPQ